MMQDRSQFSSRLRQARLDAKLKQEAVARYLKIPTSAVSSFESGQRKLDAQELYMLSKLYQRPMEWFFNDVPSYQFVTTRQPGLDVDDPVIGECLDLLKKAPRHLRQSAAYGIIGFLSER